MAMFVTGQYMEDVITLPLWMLVGAAIGALGAERHERRGDGDDSPPDGEEEEAEEPPQPGREPRPVPLAYRERTPITAAETRTAP
jgi:hypothetical protein